jgi:hypothetical protein
VPSTSLARTLSIATLDAGRCGIIDVDQTRAAWRGL